MKITLASKEAWHACLERLQELPVDYASGSEKDLTITIYSGEEHLDNTVYNCEYALNPYEDYPG